MKHLTFEEMTGFASVSAVGEASVGLMQRVNGHIRTCKECREKVKAYQSVYDGLSELFVKSAGKEIKTPVQLEK